LPQAAINPLMSRGPSRVIPSADIAATTRG
jgi:hypothetical protein